MHKILICDGGNSGLTDAIIEKLGDDFLLGNPHQQDNVIMINAGYKNEPIDIKLLGAIDNKSFTPPHKKNRRGKHKRSGK